jgi:hypothetical protein
MLSSSSVNDIRGIINILIGMRAAIDTGKSTEAEEVITKY